MFVVRVSAFLRSGGSRVVRFACPSRSAVARLLWRLRAARRWWWSAPPVGSRAFLRVAPLGFWAGRRSLRSLFWGFFLGGVVRVAVLAPSGAVWSSRVPGALAPRRGVRG